jgi:transcriptional repressor NrdR
VTDSRLSSDGCQVRRRRECAACKERFTTYESAELMLPRLIKNDGSRVLFEEQKLRAGMLRALEKRPVEIERVEMAINRIRQRLLGLAEREVTTRQLGEFVMEELERLDRVAYVRFASVYRSFQDVSEFKDVVDQLEQESAE